MYVYVTKIHNITNFEFDTTMLRVFFDPKTDFLNFFQILPQHFFILKEIEIERNKLKLNEIACIYFKQFWTHWYMVLIPYLQKWLQGKHPKLTIHRKIKNFHKTWTDHSIDLKFYLNCQSSNVTKIYKNQSCSFILTSFIEFLIL